MAIRGVAGVFLEVRTIFQTILPFPPYNNVLIWCFISDLQLLLTDISSNHNLPSVLFEFIYPAACYHLRPSSCLFSKYIGPPLVVSLETVGGVYLQTLEEQYKTKQTTTRNWASCPKIVQNMDSSIRRISHYLERIHVSIRKTNFVIHYIERLSGV